MSEKPIVGIISCNKTLEGEPAYTLKARYLEGVARHADCAPVIIPSTGRMEHALPILGCLDALVLTGSTSNVAPNHYGGTSPGHAPLDPMRDQTAITLVRGARQMGLPVIGICRGFQEINVALGGTLRDMREKAELSERHHSPQTEDLDVLFGHRHKVEVSPVSLLERLTGAKELTVNSVHYQAIDKLGDGLRVEASAEDGVIEAVVSREAEPQIFAVQWHPEWQPDAEPHHLLFWRQVGEMARRGMATRSQRGARHN